MKLIIMDGVSATPAMFATYEEAYTAVENMNYTPEFACECRVISEGTIDCYIAEVYGNKCYGIYDVHTARWCVKEDIVAGYVDMIHWRNFLNWFERSL